MVSFKHLLLSLGFSCAHDPRRIKSALGKVQFVLTCNATALECRNVAKVLDVAGECLDNVIAIKEAIVIAVDYIDKCNGKKTCFSGTVARTWEPPSEAGGRIGYPQALVKQLGIGRVQPSRFGPYDMSIALDTSVNFHMVGDVKFTGGQISLVNVVSHEMLHGLGIWPTYRELDDNLVMPYSIVVNGFARFTQNVFSSHLYTRETNKSLSSYIDKLNNLPKIHASDGVRKALLRPPYIDTIKELSSLFTKPNSIYFKTTKNNKLTLMTDFGQYIPGSSLSHLDTAYDGSRESMMTLTIGGGPGIDGLEQYQEWNTAPYGPLTLEILATLGYTLREPKWENSLGGQIQKRRIAKKRSKPRTPPRYKRQALRQ